MNATCPKSPAHKEFITTAQVSQTWRVNPDGEFLSEVSTDEVVHWLNKHNVWTCAISGEDAKV